ncbi:DUF3300 domain-containing protein [Alteromonas aestuariivivens]|uniref:DUF3300 domain-containing protein n=1 Tax=Alteromonas aestuariivivens TaxID=1938339 RepID=A0A3D8M786_9ALTE|nr:DUF3300 domain-containing protein [Alteromonas aestuariivivens]RDV25510.1 DUF3300 domain-containing protein [Alteromonas aestuariivivens]
MIRFATAVLAALPMITLAPLAAQATPEPAVEQQLQNYTDAELDSLLAPIALYPDSVLTHILIASTYPLEIIAADRWRQDNLSMTAEQVEVAVDGFDWDPSVKALTPFAEVLQTMSQDLDWLQALGDNVLISQDRVLARVQVLRQHARQNGSLENNEYVRVEQDADVIVIEPASPRVVYVPYYDTRIVYGHWWHRIAPRYWHHPVHYSWSAGFYWSPSIRLSSFFYFGGIHWHDRYVAVSHRPVQHYYRGPSVRRVYSHDFQRWHHNVKHRRTPYSKVVVRSQSYVAHPARPMYRGQVDYRTNKPVLTTRSVPRDQHRSNQASAIGSQQGKHSVPANRVATRTTVTTTQTTNGPVRKYNNVKPAQLNKPYPNANRHNTQQRTVTTTKTTKPEIPVVQRQQRPNPTVSRSVKQPERGEYSRGKPSSGTSRSGKSQSNSVASHRAASQREKNH